MIGFYNYTVILTYLSLVSAVYGTTQAVAGHYRFAIACLAFCGLCDAFDGPVARTKKDRTDNEQMFGLQLDSLVDVICFGVFPALICYLLGVRSALGIFAICYYVLCAVIRLAFFNVYEMERQHSDDPGEKIFRGLPVTSISAILPVFFLLEMLMNEKVFSLLLMFLLLIVGTLFIVDFKLHKPSKKVLFLLILFTAAAVAVILIFTQYRVPEPEPEPEISEEIAELFEEELSDITPTPGVTGAVEAAAASPAAGAN